MRTDRDIKTDNLEKAASNLNTVTNNSGRIINNLSRAPSNLNAKMDTNRRANNPGIAANNKTQTTKPKLHLFFFYVMPFFYLHFLLN